MHNKLQMDTNPIVFQSHTHDAPFFYLCELLKIN